MKTKHWIVISILSFLLPISLFIFIRSQMNEADFSDVKSSTYNCDYYIDENTSVGYYGDKKRNKYYPDDIVINNAENYLQIIENTEYIYKVKITNHTYFKNGCILDMDVLDTIKGDVRDSIRVYEPIDTIFNSNIYFCRYYVPLDESEECYVFVQKCPQPIQDDVLMFSSSEYFYIDLSKTMSNLDYDPITNDSSMTIEEVMGYSCVSYNSTQQDIYLDLVNYIQNI